VWSPYGGELLLAGARGRVPSPPTSGGQVLPYVPGSFWAMLYGHSPGGGTAALAPCTPEFPGNNFQVLLRRRGARRGAISPPPRWAPREGDALLSPPDHTAEGWAEARPGSSGAHSCVRSALHERMARPRARGCVAHTGDNPPQAGFAIRWRFLRRCAGTRTSVSMSHGGKIPRAWRVGFTPGAVWACRCTAPRSGAPAGAPRSGAPAGAVQAPRCGARARTAAGASPSVFGDRIALRCVGVRLWS